MAKKKPASHEDKPSQNQENQEHTLLAASTAMDDKLENLKSLNAMLLKETVHRRQQVDSLLHSKGSLESALTRSETEKQALLVDLTRLRDRLAQLELEGHLFSVFVAVQLSQQADRDGFRTVEEVEIIEERFRSLEREMKEVLRETTEKESAISLLKEKLSDLAAEINNEREERNALKADFEVQIEETNWLRLKLAEADKRETRFQELVEKLKTESNRVMEEREHGERMIESMKRDKDLIERSLAESNRVIEELKREIEKIVGQKRRVEEERDQEVVKKNELGTILAVRNEMVMKLQREERRLWEMISDLEKKYLEGVSKETQMAKEIESLVKEMKEKERIFGGLIEEKDLVKEDLNRALKELDVQRQKTDQTHREKVEMEEVKNRTQNELSEIKKEMGLLVNAVSALEASCQKRAEKNGKLQSEVNQYRDEISVVTIEKDQARKEFDKEKKIAIALRDEVLEMEKKIKETQKVVGQMRAENGSVIEEKKELESRCDGLKKEIASLEAKVLMGGKEFDDMKAQVEAADGTLECVLKMLRSTVGSVRQSKDERGIAEDVAHFDEQVVGEEVKQYVAELEAMKNAFMSREAQVEEMRLQVAVMQNSVAAAHKGKSFWTLVSSATTVLAAASVAYIARGH